MDLHDEVKVAEPPAQAMQGLDEDDHVVLKITSKDDKEFQVDAFSCFVCVRATCFFLLSCFFVSCFLFTCGWFLQRLGAKWL